MLREPWQFSSVAERAGGRRRFAGQALAVLGQLAAQLAGLLDEEATRKARCDALFGGVSDAVAAAPAHFGQERGEHQEQRAPKLGIFGLLDAVAQPVELEQYVRRKLRAIHVAVTSCGARFALAALIGVGGDSRGLGNQRQKP